MFAACKKHESKETCNLLQQVEVRDSYRLEGEKKTQWGKNRNEPPNSLDHSTTEQVPCLQRAGTWIEGNLQPSSASRSESFLQTGGKEKTPVGKNRNEPPSTTEQVPCLQRAKHGSKETCNLLQQVGVRDSCRLEGRKKPQWGKIEMNHRVPPNRFHVCSVQSMDRRKPATFFSK